MVAPRGNAAYAEESAEVEVLYANLEKLKTLTKKIQGSMSRLETSGTVVKEAIGPTYSNTQSLQITNTNIDRVNEAIDKLRQPLDAKGQEESIIRAGPQNSGLQSYLESLKRIDRALINLTSTNLRSNQQVIADFSNLLNVGSGKLQDMFRSVLREDVRPVEPLHFLTKQLSFPTIPGERVTELTPVCSAISSAASHAPQRGLNENPAVLIYAEIRGPYLSASLQNLAMASISTAKRRPADGPYRQGSNGIGVYASGIEGIFLAEHENVVRIFTGEQQGRALQSTCRGSLAEFSKTLRELNMYIKANLMTDCFLAFEIIELVTALSYRIDSKTGELKSLFIEALRPVRETAKSSLFELLEETRRRVTSLPSLPPDGAAVPLVNEIMSSLSTLTTYSTPLASILTSLGDGNWRSASSTATTTPLDVGPDSSTLLSHFILDMIEALLSSLETRARSVHRSKSVHGVFVANTMCLVDRAIRTNSDLSRYLISTPANNARLETWRKKGISIYLDAWRETSSHLLDVQYTGRGQSAVSGNRPVSGGAVDSAAIVKSLSSKDRDNIKEKFKAFNASFDELIVRHKSLHMEREVRASLSREVQAVIEPLYARFWDRYHELDKGRGKYAKYDKGSLSAQLSSLS